MTLLLLLHRRIGRPRHQGESGDTGQQSGSIDIHLFLLVGFLKQVFLPADDRGIGDKTQIAPVSFRKV
ncbi:MAG: hypothetical protein WB760_23570 [Xanthobacteraceae bacterium]